MNDIEQLFRTLKAQPQEPEPAAPVSAPSATRAQAPGVAPASSAPAGAAVEPASAKIKPIAAHDTLVNRWPIFQSHPAKPRAPSAPLSDEEKKSRLEPSEQAQAPVPPAGAFAPRQDAGILQALKRLSEDISAAKATGAMQSAQAQPAEPAQPLADVSAEFDVAPAAESLPASTGVLTWAVDPEPANAGVVDTPDVAAEPEVAAKPDAAAKPDVSASAAMAATAAPAAGTVSASPSLDVLFDRLRGRPAPKAAAPVRRKSLASRRMTQR